MMHTKNNSYVATLQISIICSFLLLAGCLWVDTLTGFFVLELGVDIKLSLLYKLILLFIIFNTLFVLSPPTATLILIILFCLLIPAGSMLLKFGRVDLFVKDLAAALKLIVPITVFGYLYIIAKYDVAILKRWGEMAVWSNFVALNVNLVIGLLGFGYYIYEFSGGSGLGINGYYTAGNELGGVFVLFFSFALANTWDKNKVRYFWLALLTVAWGLLIATKTTILSSVLIVLFIPFFSERNKFFSLTPLKLLLLCNVIVVSVVSYIYLLPLFTSLTLWDRFVWIYESKGLLGLILSGREQYCYDLITIFSENFSIFEWFFGAGVSGVSQYTDKFSAEVDIVDIFVWSGGLGVLIMALSLFLFMWHSYQALKISTSQYAPAVALSNILLIILSFLSGHILTSGMLGFGWALLNGLVLTDLHPSLKSENHIA